MWKTCIRGALPCTNNNFKSDSGNISASCGRVWKSYSYTALSIRPRRPTELVGALHFVCLLLYWYIYTYIFCLWVWGASRERGGRETASPCVPWCLSGRGNYLDLAELVCPPLPTGVLWHDSDKNGWIVVCGASFTTYITAKGSEAGKHG